MRFSIISALAALAFTSADYIVDHSNAATYDGFIKKANHDIGGYDIKCDTSNVDVDTCHDACERDANCRAFNFVRPVQCSVAGNYGASSNLVVKVNGNVVTAQIPGRPLAYGELNTDGQSGYVEFKDDLPKYYFVSQSDNNGVCSLFWSRTLPVNPSVTKNIWAMPTGQSYGNWGPKYGCCTKTTSDSNLIKENPFVDFFIKVDKKLTRSIDATYPGYTKLPGKDIGGYDINCDTSNVDVDTCHDACVKNPECRAFNFVRPTVDASFGNWGTQYGCCTKTTSNSELIKENPNVDFFVKIDETVEHSNNANYPGYTKHPGHDIGGYDISCNTNFVDVDTCHSECNSNPACLAFNFVRPVQDSSYGNWGSKYGCCTKTTADKEKIAINPNVDFFVKDPTPVPTTKRVFRANCPYL